MIIYSNICLYIIIYFNIYIYISNCLRPSRHRAWSVDSITSHSSLQAILPSYHLIIFPSYDLVYAIGAYPAPTAGDLYLWAWPT